jgi:hypothetical protein
MLKTSNGTYKKQSNIEAIEATHNGYYDETQLIKFQSSRKPENNGTPDIAKEAINMVAKGNGHCFSLHLMLHILLSVQCMNN